MLSAFKVSIFLLLTALSLSVVVTSCQKTQESIKAKNRDMVISVYASALVKPSDLYRLYPESAGLIKDIYFEEGDTVTKGQTIAKIESVRENYDLQTAKLQKTLVEEKLAGQSNELQLIQRDINKLHSQFEIDSINYFRQKSLWAKEIGSKTELDNKKLKYTLSQQSLSAAEERLAQTSTELTNRLEQAKVSLQRSLARLDNFNITVQNNGRIYSLSKEKGESINTQEYFAEIGAKDHFILEMQIDEQDIAAVSTGQEILVTLDAYPEQNFEAIVSRIYPSKNLRTQSFKVEAEFSNRPDKLYAGLSAEANIIIDKKKDILTIPLEYLTAENKVITKDGNELTPVLGEQNMQYIEIKSGLDSLTEIVKPSS